MITAHVHPYPLRDFRKEKRFWQYPFDHTSEHKFALDRELRAEDEQYKREIINLGEKQ